MNDRTYTINADIFDKWVKSATRDDGSAYFESDNEMIGAWRAQQPKPRIKWAPGLKVRRKSWAKDQFMTCCFGADQKQMCFVAWDHYIHTWWVGFSNFSGEFDDNWEVA
jgi:hypothetical protein